MASAKGLISLATSVLASSVSSHWCAPCGVRASLGPLVTQIRHRNKKKTRFRAPAEPKVKEKWVKREKSSKKKFASTAQKAPLPEAFLSRVPVDDVWIRAHYPWPSFSLEQCLDRHREFADPTMLDNMDGLVYADMQLDMRTSKKTKFLANVKGTILLPYLFEQSQEKEQKIAIFCKTDEDLEKAKSLGAPFIGGADLVKQMQDGLVDKDDVDVVLCTPDIITELIPIKSKLRDKFPSKAKGSVGSDVDEMWTLFTKGVTYSSHKESEAVGKVQVALGQMNMSNEQLVANFKAFVDHMCKGRAKNLGPLITQIFLVAPPSTERFLLQLEDCVPGYKKAEIKAEDSESKEKDTA